MKQNNIVIYNLGQKMENSFFEYRDQSGVEVESDSDTDIIEESMLEDLMPKTPMRNNHTVVPDSDESLIYDGSEDEKDTPQVPKNVIGSSDDDGTGSRQASRRSHHMPSSDAVSSDEEDISPELVPKRRPPTRPKSLNTTTDSPVIRRVKKRMVLLDSDTDNSIIIEKNEKSKLKCLKHTPLKIDDGKYGKVNDSEESGDEAMENDGESNGDYVEESDYDANSEEKIYNGKSTDDSDVEKDSSHDEDMDEGKDDKDNGSEQSDDDDANVGEERADDHNEGDDDDEGPNEDLMVMSHATRMSIMGIIPKQNESDESDFIESDESVKRSIEGLNESLTDLPADISTSRIPLAESTRRVTDMNRSPLEEASLDSDSDLPKVNITIRTPHKPKTPKPVTPVKALEDNNDDSVVFCSPIESPLRDFTADFNNSPKSSRKTLKDRVLNYLLANDNQTYYEGEVTVVDDGFAKPKSKITKNSYYDGEVTVVEETGKAGKENVYEDEDVAVIESVPEVIMLSSDEEDEATNTHRDNSKNPKHN